MPSQIDMIRNYLTLSFLSLITCVFSQTDTISVDFGNDFSPPPWNNVSDPNTGGIANLIDQKSNSTGVSISVVDSFNNINTSGTQDPDPALGLPPSATGDSFFGNTATFGGQEQPTAGIQFSNLDTSRVYTLSIFASRAATDNREAQYIISGRGADTVYLNSASNTDMVAVTDMRPDNSGTVNISVSPGPNNTNSSGFYYLGSIQLIYDEVPVLTERDTVSIDFGDDISAVPWNNLANPINGSISMLLNQNGTPTSFGISVIDTFNNINRTGTQSPNPDLGFPPSSTGDSFFGNVAPFGGQEQPTGGIQLENLTQGKAYEITIFASRDASDNREAQYAISGLTTDTLYLDASSNTDMVVTTEIEPDTNGSITLIASPGPNNNNSSGFYYLGAIRMSYDAEPVVLASDTVLIDFGDILSISPWNNLTDPHSGLIEDLVDGNGNSTGFGVTVVDSFNNINRTGTQSPNPDMGYPPSSTGDSFFGNVAPFGGQEQPQGAVEIFNLDTNFIYTFEIFASRDAGDNREAQYVLDGLSSDTVYLDAASNDSLTISSTMVPDNSGTIRMTVSPGPNNNNSSGFYYLGLLKMTWELKPAVASVDTILLDFGNAPTTSPLPWNNITDPQTGQISDLLLTNTLSSGVSIEIYDAFNNINTNGTLSPNPALGMPPSATGDSFFGNVATFGGQEQPTAAMVMRNFDPSVPVQVVLFASRIASDNRETQYIITGVETDTVYLNAASNTDSVAAATLLPAADGTIDIHVSPGPNNNNSSGFYYLGALKVIYESSRNLIGSLELSSPNGGEFWQVGKTPTIRWKSKNVQDVVLEYSVDNGNSWEDIGTYPAVNQEVEWTVPNQPTDQALIRITGDTLVDVSDAVFTISDDTTTCNIVVLGSSTAEGTGASADSSWVERYNYTLSQNNTSYNVINLARGGYTTYHILPTGTPIPGGVNITIDTARNITKALTYDPIAIIVNMPSNDAARGFDVSAQLENFELLFNSGQSNGSFVYIATTQPRNFTDQNQIDIQIAVKDSILEIYGNQAIDFWSEIAENDGTIDPAYDSGDGVHLNNDGHAILYDRVLQERIDTLCSSFVGLFNSNLQELEGINLYPNPFENEINGLFKAESSGTMTFSIYDLYGRLAHRELINMTQGGENSFNIHPPRDLASGMYVILAQWTSDNIERGKYFTMIKQ